MQIHNNLEFQKKIEKDIIQLENNIYRCKNNLKNGQECYIVAKPSFEYISNIIRGKEINNKDQYEKMERKCLEIIDQQKTNSLILVKNTQAPGLKSLNTVQREDLNEDDIEIIDKSFFEFQKNKKLQDFPEITKEIVDRDNLKCVLHHPMYRLVIFENHEKGFSEGLFKNLKGKEIESKISEIISLKYQQYDQKQQNFLRNIL